MDNFKIYLGEIVRKVIEEVWFCFIYLFFDW